MRPGIFLLLSIAPLAPASTQGLAFVVARYASQSTHTLYAGYDAGPGIVFGGILQNPRSGYRESTVGIARAFGTARANVMLGLAAATTSDGDYAQAYVLPAVALGPVDVDATVTLQARFAGGPGEIYVAPANAFVAVRRRWQVGVTWTLGATFGGSHSQAVGPAATFAVPGGTVGLHALHGLGARRDEIWVSARLRP